LRGRSLAALTCRRTTGFHSISLPVHFRELQPADYDAVIALWQSADGVVLSAADARAPLTAYLQRNAGLSTVAVSGGEIVGAVLCGTDGRRGYLQHLAVASAHRRQGIGRQLAERCAQLLAERGIDKCHLMVLASNANATAFWTRAGWLDRTDLRLMSRPLALDR
jgi:ribosomal protein S18 acetylase RimI-like enzyme